jgi:photosynthetic reaction center H subunit
MGKDYRNEDGVQIMPLGELRDFEVAKGYPDVRGWRVESVDGQSVGEVHELLVDADSMRTRYLDVRLTSVLAATPGDRDVLVPIGAAHLEEKDEKVSIPLHAERICLLPPYEHDALTRAQEYEIRRHFSLGEAAATAAAGPTHNFYDHETFDDRSFFSGRRADTPRADEGAVTDTRIPVDPGDSVVLKRGLGGRDEIIIRRPATDEGRMR